MISAKERERDNKREMKRNREMKDISFEKKY